MNVKIIIRLPEKLKVFLDDMSNDLYDDFKGRYQTKDEFWVTLKEIDNINNFKLKQIKSALKIITSKSDPFTLYCDNLIFENPRKKSPLVYTLKGFTNKLYTLHQNIENTLYTREIERNPSLESPNILIAEKLPYRQLPKIHTPNIPIDVVSIELIEKKQTIVKTTYEKIEEFPLFGGHLIVKKIDYDNVVCENSYGKLITFDLLEMPKEIKEKDVIIKTGNQYTVDQNETRVRSIHEQIKRETSKKT